MRYLIALIIILPYSAFAQSPWVKKKNEGYAQLSYSSISNYQSIYTKSNNSTTLLERVMDDRTIQVYSEYGITDKWTLTLNAPLKLVQSGALTSNTANPITSSGSLTGLGNIDLAARYQLGTKWVYSAAQLKVSSFANGYDESTGLSTGIPAWSIEPMLSVGQGGNFYYGYLYAGVGFRTHDYSHYTRFGIEAGIDIKKRLWLILFMDAVVSFYNGSVTERPGNLQTGLYLNNQEYIAFGPKIIVEVVKDQFGVTGSAGGAVGANNVPVQLSTTFGLYYKWK